MSGNRPERPRETFTPLDLDQLTRHVNPIVKQLVAELQWWKAEARFQNERAITAETALREAASRDSGDGEEWA